jgi:hypothetical protein
MTEPTLDDAKVAIEKAKAARVDCDECTRLSYDCLFRLDSGEFVPLDGLQELLAKATREFLTERGFEEIAYKPGYIKRCAKCRNTPTFPWADRLDAEKVLAFMVQQNERGAFWLGELEKLV